MTNKNEGTASRIYLVVNFVILILITILFTWHATRYYSDWNNGLESFMKNMAVSLSYPAWTYDKRVIEQITAVMIEKDEIISVVVYDDKNNKLVVKEKKLNLTTTDLLFGTKRLDRTYNLIYADTYVGKVIFTYIDRSTRTFLVVSGTGAALLYIVSALLILNIKKNKKLAVMVNELNELNAELEMAFNELEETQNKIINAEKMAALGKLMVNIAHDINTPAGIIYSSLTEQQNRIDSIVKKFQSDQLTEEDFKDCLDTISELNQIMLRNAKRIIELVQSLKRTAMNEMTQTWSEST
ncbi:sensor histidine kinase [Fervidobacterium ngatamarikiense]|uniref:hypothetical protein n=1 Tax=Fervidobacterium ngatamarikiense TaxID=3389972 RepID=UPI0009EE777D|nr:hypothetical protein [Fervidobacterium pennivorans]